MGREECERLKEDDGRYALAIFFLNLFIGFLSPVDDDEGGPALPMMSEDEFKPFVRRLPEFKFWYVHAW